MIARRLPASAAPLMSAFIVVMLTTFMSATFTAMTFPLK
jgi:hypothetical protein